MRQITINLTVETEIEARSVRIGSTTILGKVNEPFCLCLNQWSIINMISIGRYNQFPLKQICQTVSRAVFSCALHTFVSSYILLSLKFIISSVFNTCFMCITTHWCIISFKFLTHIAFLRQNVSWHAMTASMSAHMLIFIWIF